MSSSIAKTKQPNSYYEIRVRSVDGQSIFKEEADYWLLLSLFENAVPASASGAVKILAYCLESNQVSLLVYQSNRGSAVQLLDKVTVEYDRYCGHAYGRVGSIFQKEWDVTRISPARLLQASYRIHKCPDKWLDCPHTSLRAYLYDDVPVWLDKTHIASRYGTAVRYLKLLQAYQN